MLPWEEEEESVQRTGPVTGRSYSTKMGDKYVMEGVIGRGQSGVVSQCRHKESGRVFACKTVYKAPLIADNRLDELKREVRIASRYTEVAGAWGEGERRVGTPH